MAISRVKTWVAAEVLTASDLNAEVNNILNNALDLVSPWTANMAAGGFRLTGLALGTAADPSLQFTVDTNTGIFSNGTDQLDISAGGGRILAIAGPISSALVTVLAEDARTATVDVPMIVRSTTTGVPAADIGVGLQFDAESADENPSVFGQIEFAASDVGAGTEDTYFQVLLRVAGAAIAAAYRWVATTAFRAIFTHANSADRTYTLPNAAGTFDLIDVAQTVSGVKTFTGAAVFSTAPTIANPTITGAAPATPAANVVYTDSIIKGWVIFDGTGVISLLDDLNVSSLTDNGVGDYTVNWATAFASANYACTSIAGNNAAANPRFVSHHTIATTSMRIVVFDDIGGAQDVNRVHLIAIGDQ